MSLDTSIGRYDGTKAEVFWIDVNLIPVNLNSKLPAIRRALGKLVVFFEKRVYMSLYDSEQRK